MTTNLPTEETAWQRIRMAGLTRLVNAPPPLRWRWEPVVQDGRKTLWLVSPRGRRWRFRLKRGAWIQPETGKD